MIVESDVRKPEPPSDQKAVLENLLDLAWRCVGADVEILGRAAKQQVADSAAHQIGGKTLAHQTVYDLERIGMDVLAGNRMFRSGNYN